MYVRSKIVFAFLAHKGLQYIPALRGRELLAQPPTNTTNHNDSHPCILYNYKNTDTHTHMAVPKLSHTVCTREIQPCTHVNSFPALPDCSSLTSPHGSQGCALNDSISQHLLSVCLFISVQHVLKNSFELVLGLVICSFPSVRPICSGHLIMSLLSLHIIWIHCQSSCIYHPFSFIWTLDIFLNDNICYKCLVESVSRFCKQAVFMRLADYFCRYKLCKEINGIIQLSALQC